MARRCGLRAAVLGVSVLMLAASCASSAKSGSSDEGVKVLQAVVTDREFQPVGSAGAGGVRGSGAWYVTFEARDGDKTVRYQFSVTQQQYLLCSEGRRVELVVSDDRLRDVRPAKD